MQARDKKLSFLGADGKRLVRLILGFSIFVATVGCGRSGADFQKNLDTAVGRSTRSDSADVEIASLTDFKWDRLYVFGPYTPVSQIQTSLGYKWNQAESTGIHMSDGFNLIVFTEQGEVTRYFKIPRNTVDFVDLKRKNTFIPTEAFFSVAITDSRKVARFKAD